MYYMVLNPLLLFILMSQIIIVLSQFVQCEALQTGPVLFDLCPSFFEQFFTSWRNRIYHIPLALFLVQVPTPAISSES